jgi:hypothetical protein
MVSEKFLKMDPSGWILWMHRALDPQSVPSQSWEIVEKHFLERIDLSKITSKAREKLWMKNLETCPLSLVQILAAFKMNEKIYNVTQHQLKRVLLDIYDEWPRSEKLLDVVLKVIPLRTWNRVSIFQCDDDFRNLSTSFRNYMTFWVKIPLTLRDLLNLPKVLSLCNRSTSHLFFPNYEKLQNLVQGGFSFQCLSKKFSRNFTEWAIETTLSEPLKRQSMQQKTPSFSENSIFKLVFTMENDFAILKKVSSPSSLSFSFALHSRMLLGSGVLSKTSVWVRIYENTEKNRKKYSPFLQVHEFTVTPPQNLIQSICHVRFSPNEKFIIFKGTATYHREIEWITDLKGVNPRSGVLSWEQVPPLPFLLNPGLPHLLRFLYFISHCKKSLVLNIESIFETWEQAAVSK